MRSVSGFLPVGAAEPEMEIAVVGRELDGGFAVDDGLVPLLFLVIDAAAQVVGLGIAGIVGERCGEGLESAVGAAEDQVVARAGFAAPAVGPSYGGEDKRDTGLRSSAALRKTPPLLNYFDGNAVAQRLGIGGAQGHDIAGLADRW